MAKDKKQPSIEGNYLRLRSLQKSDLHQLYLWHTDLRTLHLWSSDRKIVTELEFEEEFQRKLRRLIDTIFLVEKNDGTSVGFIYSYNTSEIDGHTSFVIFIDPDFRGKGLAIETVMLFGKQMTETFGFRKFYTEVYDFNPLSMSTLISSGFRKEATLNEYRYYDNRYWDLNILSIDKETFIEQYNKYSARWKA